MLSQVWNKNPQRAWNNKLEGDSLYVVSKDNFKYLKKFLNKLIS